MVGLELGDVDDVMDAGGGRQEKLVSHRPDAARDLKRPKVTFGKFGTCARCNRELPVRLKFEKNPGAGKERRILSVRIGIFLHFGLSIKEIGFEATEYRLAIAEFHVSGVEDSGGMKIVE